MLGINSYPGSESPPQEDKNTTTEIKANFKINLFIIMRLFR